MKVCLNSNQSKEYLQKADEIKVRDFKNREIVPTLLEEYPQANIILTLPFNSYLSDEELQDIKTYNILSQGRLILCLSDPFLYGDFFKENNIKFYYGFPISSYFQLDAILSSGSCYIKLDAPLFFELDKVVKYGVPIRAVPNLAYSDGLQRVNGVLGTWIRPEDIDAYDEYISVIEFEDCNVTKEQALYRIYKEDKEWSLDLGDLVTNFNHTGSNRMILPELSQRRINCGQRCLSGGGCHICYRILDLANPEKIKEYAQSIKKGAE